MPILPPTTPRIYDRWSNMLNAARFRLHQKMPSLSSYSGSILDASQADTLQSCINAYRRLQDSMCDAGAHRFESEIVIIGIPPAASTDPATQSHISWFECFDGVNSQSTPTLPDTLLIPLWMSERPTLTGSFPPANKPNMTQRLDGLSMANKQPLNGQWEWRGDAIYYPGATMTVDFRIRFRSYLSDPADSGTARWFNTPVPIMRCQDALVWWMCREFSANLAASREAPPNALALAATCEAQALVATKLLVNRDVMQNDRVNIRRQPYGNGGGSGRC